jgi:branched-chain amino acid transport system ATP-binding protein
MKQHGLTTVISEQNLHFARLISDRAYIVEKGRVRFEGTMQELEANPEIRDAYLAV